MKSKIAQYMMMLLTIASTQAFADDQVAAIRWTENAQTVRITMEEIKNAAVPPLGYVLDFPKKQNLCYEGKDFEAVDLLFAGLNRHGVELCDKYIIVTNLGTLVVGPCQQPNIHEEFYSAEVPACAK